VRVKEYRLVSWNKKLDQPSDASQSSTTNSPSGFLI